MQNNYNIKYFSFGIKNDIKDGKIQIVVGDLTKEGSSKWSKRKFNYGYNIAERQAIIRTTMFSQLKFDSVKQGCHTRLLGFLQMTSEDSVVDSQNLDSDAIEYDTFIPSFDATSVI